MSLGAPTRDSLRAAQREIKGIGRVFCRIPLASRKYPVRQAMDLDPIPQVWRDDPFPFYAALREEHPVHYVASRDLWVLSRYGDVTAVPLPEEPTA